ncbi:MAG: hypothetical protein NT099_06900 [Candidatus Saganbacteria bacterium]|nr:hypothetical protein [Candidatus Saganbacteria bacterium]
MKKYEMSEVGLFEFVKNAVLVSTVTSRTICLEVKRIQKGVSKLLPSCSGQAKNRMSTKRR